jgi:hypothetical protein
VPSLKAADITHRRLYNSGLTRPSFKTPEQVVRRHGAMQAQDYGLAKWSIGQRATGVAEGAVDEALTSGKIIRTHVLRPTWHFAAREDVRWMLELTAPRVLQRTDKRRRDLGLDQATLKRCESLIAAELEGGNQLTRIELGGVLESKGIGASLQRLPHILMLCELNAVICSGGMRGKQHTYAFFDERVSRDGVRDRAEALGELVRRYLSTHGPATLKDLSWWSGLTIGDIKEGLGGLGSDVSADVLDGVTFWSISEDRGEAAGRNRGAHLLQAFDELLVGYSESRYFGDPRAAEARAAWSDRSLPSGVVLHNGLVSGHWRRSVRGKLVTVEAFVYEKPTRLQLRAFEVAIADLAQFLDCEPNLKVVTL